MTDATIAAVNDTANKGKPPLNQLPKRRSLTLLMGMESPDNRRKADDSYRALTRR